MQCFRVNTAVINKKKSKIIPTHYICPTIEYESEYFLESEALTTAQFFREALPMIEKADRRRP